MRLQFPCFFWTTLPSCTDNVFIETMFRSNFPYITIDQSSWNVNIIVLFKHVRGHLQFVVWWCPGRSRWENRNLFRRSKFALLDDFDILLVKFIGISSTYRWYTNRYSIFWYWHENVDFVHTFLYWDNGKPRCVIIQDEKSVAVVRIFEICFQLKLLYSEFGHFRVIRACECTSSRTKEACAEMELRSIEWITIARLLCPIV